MRPIPLILAGLLTGALGAHAAWGQPGAELSSLRLPDGFRIELWAEGVRDARSLARSPSGTVYVGTRRGGVVHALRDDDGDGRAERHTTVASGLNQPNGVAFRDGALYVAEIHRVLRFDGIDDRLDDPPAPVVVRDDLPTDRHHGWKFIRFGPDGRLYVPVGAPCNVCAVEDPYAAILRMQPDGSELEVFARGIHAENQQVAIENDGRRDQGAEYFLGETARRGRGRTVRRRAVQFPGLTTVVCCT